MAEEKIKDIGEFIQPSLDMEGNQLKVDDLVDETIVIRAFATRPSKMSDGNYASVQIDRADGKKAWFNTGSAPVLEALETVKDVLPVTAKLTSKKSEAGRNYFILESAAEAKREEK